MTLHTLFDFQYTDHAQLFDSLEYGWEVLPRIAEYIQERTKDAPDNILIGEGTVIEPGVTIQGPAIIGKNCTIRSGAYIRENSIIGDDCMIGNSTEVKNALLCNGVQVPHFNYIGDSILGYRVHLGAGAIISNFKSAQSTISVRMNDSVIDTGLHKFGALVGDNVDVGANAVLTPGSIIGKGAIIYPLALIRGTIAPDTIVKVRQQHEVVTKF